MQGSFPQDLKVPQFVCLFLFVRIPEVTHARFVSLKTSQSPRVRLFFGFYMLEYECKVSLLKTSKVLPKKERNTVDISGWVLVQGGHLLVNWCQGGSFHRGEIL